MKFIRNMHDKYKAMPEAVKSAFAFTVCSLLLRGIAFLVTPIFTRLMTSEQYGIISTYNSWQTILEVFAFLGLTYAGVFNVGLNDFRDDRDRYISSLLGLTNLTTLLTFLVVFMIQFVFGKEILMPSNLLFLMFIQFLFSPAETFWITRQRYEFRYKLAVAVTVASTVLSQVCAIVCVMNVDGSYGAVAKLWSSGLVMVLFYIPIYIYLLRKGKCIYDGKIWKQTLCFAIPLLPHYLSQHVMSGADRIMIANMESSSAAGIYSIVAAIGIIATFFWSAIQSSLTPYAYDNMNEGKYNEIDAVVFKLLCFYALVCVCVSLCAPEIMMILAPAEYAYGVYAVPPFAAVAFLNALYNVYAMIEFYNKSSKNIASATIVSCVCNIVLNAICIPLFGFIAAAYTTLISNLVLILMHYVGYRKCQKSRVFNDRRIFGLAALCILLVEACLLLYDFFIARLLIVIAVGFFVLLKRKQIIALIHRK